jgi:hypothetical protein
MELSEKKNEITVSKVVKNPTSALLNILTKVSCKYCKSSYYLSIFDELFVFNHSKKQLSELYVFKSTIKSKFIRINSSTNWKYFEKIVNNIEINLHPREEFLLEYVVKKTFRRIENYPHDANYGIIIPPSTVCGNSIHGLNNSTVKFIIRSETNLVPRMLPDFSMPFNVITLVSTVSAFLLGSFINILVRKRK